MEMGYLFTRPQKILLFPGLLSEYSAYDFAHNAYKVVISHVMSAVCHLMRAVCHVMCAVCHVMRAVCHVMPCCMSCDTSVCAGWIPR